MWSHDACGHFLASGCDAADVETTSDWLGPLEARATVKQQCPPEPVRTATKQDIRLQRSGHNSRRSLTNQVWGWVVKDEPDCATIRCQFQYEHELSPQEAIEFGRRCQHHRAWFHSSCRLHICGKNTTVMCARLHALRHLHIGRENIAVVGIGKESPRSGRGVIRRDFLQFAECARRFCYDTCDGISNGDLDRQVQCS